VVKRRPKQTQRSPELLEIFAAANAMTASGQEPRRHHLVPRFYLERWAENGRVFVTDLDARKSHQVDPKNALIETDFYRVPPGTTSGSDSPVIWEAWLSKIEGSAAEVFAKLDRDGFARLSADELGILAAFLAVQTTRSRSFRYQGRWMSSMGLHRSFELDKPGRIEEALRASGEDPSSERVTEVETWWARIIADPWLYQLPASWEMDAAQGNATAVADLFATRKWVVYDSPGALLTADEPVANLHQFMGADHVQDGGYFGSPIIAFPIGPHQVLAMFRENIPVVRHPRDPLSTRDSLDLNLVFAGNAYRNVISKPSRPVGSKLLVPERKDPSKLYTHGDKGEFLRWRSMRRWSDERDAPVRPVASWWPAVVPAPPRPPSSHEVGRQTIGLGGVFGPS
jgi:hypothetical protein